LPEKREAVKDDGELVREATRGDAPAREELVRRYLRKAFRVALAILQNVADAEDIAQEAISTALERLPECRIPDRFGGWLLRGVRNRALNQRAQLGNRLALLAGMPGEEAEEFTYRDLPLGRAVLAALEQLPPVRRTVVLLHDVEEWTHAEIAASLRITVVMSRQHLYWARKALRDLLDPEDGLASAT
jgi:RNA polymerase sigma-70 factor (ECF subfamily)